MHGDIDRVLIDRHAIARRVQEVAGQIAADLRAHQPPEGAGPPLELTLVPILTGSFIFVADLIRHLPVRMRIRLISVSAYPGATTVSRGASVREHLTDLPPSLAGDHVLVIDDILDSGGTLSLVKGLIQSRNPASIRTCVLLRKERPQALAADVDYVCFDIPDQFVVGYGLDYDDFYRNLPDIVTLRPELLTPKKGPG